MLIDAQTGRQATLIDSDLMEALPKYIAALELTLRLHLDPVTVDATLNDLLPQVGDPLTAEQRYLLWRLKQEAMERLDDAGDCGA